MADDNRLGEKIVTLRTAHHLSSRDLADRCGCDVSVIEGLERGELPASLAPLIKITRALGVRLGTLMDDDENLGPAYIDRDQMEEVERTKSLETTSGGDLSYFSLAAGRPSRHMDPFVITVDPSGEADHELVGHEGEEWLYGMELSLIHISEPTRQAEISYAVFCLKKKKDIVSEYIDSV